MLEQWEGRFFITFTVVLEEKSFSRAADRLGYVQSTVTSHIRHLEMTSGKKLFHRLPRGVEPTEAGLQFAPYAYQFIKLGQSLQDAMVETDMPTGMVRLCSLESFSVSHFPTFLTQFLKQYTKVKLHLMSGLNGDIISQVANHRADLGIVPQDPQRDDLLFTPLLEEKLALICAPVLRERLNKESWGALNDAAFISFGEGCVYHTYGLDVLQAVAIKPEDQLSFSSMELIKHTVSCGMGIAFVPESNINAEVAAGTLLSLPYDRELTLTHGIITHHAREPKAAARAFIESLTNYYAK